MNFAYFAEEEMSYWVKKAIPDILTQLEHFLSFKRQQSEKNMPENSNFQNLHVGNGIKVIYF